MKKNDPNYLALQLKRERKELKRRKKGKTFQGHSSTYHKLLKFWTDNDWRVRSESSFLLYDFFVRHKFIDGRERINEKIIIPEKFSLIDDFDNSIVPLKNFFASTYLLQSDTITLDFSQCKHCDQSAIFVLQIFKLDLLEYFNQLDIKLKVLKRDLKFVVIDSPREKVNKLLLMGGLLSKTNISDNEKMHPVHTLGYYKGVKSQKHYIENRKGVITTNLAKYVNQCLLDHEFEFNPEGINEFEGLISEILSNAEDHSPFNTYYVTGNFQREKTVDKNGSIVGEINLSIMNFGFSIYQGFEENKTENAEIYNLMDKLYTTVAKTPFFSFNKENLFTLYALQDGISRLKYQDESRGTGTMKFINSFFSFGDYEDFLKQYFPSLTFFSGGTELTCDNKYKPFEKSGMFSLSLNQEKDLTVPPKNTHLRSLKFPFPGTLLSIRLFINKEHIDKKINHGTQK